MKVAFWPAAEGTSSPPPPSSAAVPRPRLLGAIGTVLGGDLVGRLLGLLFVVVAARALAVEEFGVLRYVLDAALMGMLLVQGHITTLIRFVAHHRSQEEGGRAHFATALLLIALFVAVTGGLLFLVSRWLDASWLWIFLVVVGNTCFATASALASAVERASSIAGSYLLMNTSQLVAAGLYWRLAANPRVEAFLLFYALSGVLAAAVYLPRLARLLGEGAWRVRRALAGPLLRFSAPLTLAQVGHVIWTGLDTILVMHVFGAVAAGIFGVAKTLALPFRLFSSSANAVLLPRFSHPERGGHLRLLLWTAGSSLVLAAVGLLGIWVLGDWVVETFFSSRYQGARLLWMGTALSAVLYSLYLPLTSFALGRGQPAVYAWSMLLGAALEVALAPWLLARFHLAGAALLGVVGIGGALLAAVGMLTWSYRAELPLILGRGR